MRIRPTAVAGSFYPADPQELEAVVREHLASGVSSDEEEGEPKALIVPHAGFVYSGPVAGSAYLRLRSLRDRIERVVLLGPSHRVPFRGIASSTADAFITPLGTLPIDREAVLLAESLVQVSPLDAAHQQEHSLEVQLPFLQCVLDAFRLVPFAVGDASGEQVAELIELLWGGPETLIVVSSDLSHYLDYENARRMDAATTRAIEALQPEALDYDSACGQIPARGLLIAARRHALRARTLDLRNSGDTAGPRDRVVGYGAYLFG